MTKFAISVIIIITIKEFDDQNLNFEEINTIFEFDNMYALSPENNKRKCYTLYKITEKCFQPEIIGARAKDSQE